MLKLSCSTVVEFCKNNLRVDGKGSDSNPLLQQQYLSSGGEG